MKESNNFVRAATSADLEALVPLFDGYRRSYEQASDRDAARAFLGERLERGESVILLALSDEQPAGFTQLYPCFSSVRMRRTWILNDLFVAEAHRRKGIGRQLLQAAEDFARADDAAYLTLQTNDDNHNAQRLYEATGWERDPTFHYERML